jgi:hemolysin activation/secretion protein
MNSDKAWIKRFSLLDVLRADRRLISFWFPGQGIEIITVVLVLAATLRLASAAEQPHFTVRNYVVNGGSSLSSNTVNALLSNYTGSKITVPDLVKAASALQLAYANNGYTNLSVAISADRITNGTVSMNVFHGLVPQILISGNRYTNELLAASAQSPAAQVPPKSPTPSRTNAPPGFLVRAYEITGDTLLSTKTLMSIFAKRTGTNVTINDILQGASELQAEYRDRGYPTVKVSLPQQTITNGMVKIQVFEGRIADILVVKNHFFSSNNVMRALPSLHTNTILNGPVFQAELDRANANQDRQIYPFIEPGPVPGSSDLRLEVKDRLPLHGRIDFNNQSSPGTPELRLNSSASYNNLWQLEHSFGVQYGFSPGQYKAGDQWNFYDLPLVANYSGFYRLPIGNFEPEEQAVAQNPGTFGYNEATRRFQLPSPSGRPELNFYGSRSTIDSGLMILSDRILTETPSITVRRQDVQQDLTINEAVGFRLSAPLLSSASFRSTVSAGLDYKSYELTSYKTNNFLFTTIIHDEFNNPVATNVSLVPSAVPTTVRYVEYLPLTLRWDASRPDKLGTTTFGLAYSPNFFGGLFGNSISNFQSVAGSHKANGYYNILIGSLARDQVLYKDWRATVRLDGQWANQPLISNEQYGIGGIAGVRGYREAEILGDTGWRVTSELKTPPQVIGNVSGKSLLVVRGSIFMDYADAFLLDPNGRPSRASLWGTGFGGIATIGANWEARLLFSWPLISTATVEAGQPRFDFGLSFQF